MLVVAAKSGNSPPPKRPASPRAFSRLRAALKQGAAPADATGMRRVAASTVGLTAAALAASIYVALTVGGLGDYPGDGGPALTALLHGDLHAFAAAKPAMGAFALLVRV